MILLPSSALIPNVLALIPNVLMVSGHSLSRVRIKLFWGVLIDLMIELLDLRIKCFDNQTDIFTDLGLIIKPFDNRDFLDI